MRITSLSAGSFVTEKALIPNYYPAIVVPKAFVDQKLKQRLPKRIKGVPMVLVLMRLFFPHGDNAKNSST
jgi:hypothetical protein